MLKVDTLSIFLRKKLRSIAYRKGIMIDPVYEYLQPSLPADHANQSRATDVVTSRVLQGFSPRNVLDLGCGTGSSLDFLSKVLPNARWVGVDIEESPEVGQRTRTDAEFVTFDGVSLPFQDAEFDLVYSNQVFEHVRFPEKLLAEVRRVLSPSGLFIGQTSHLEPFHSFSYWNFTVWGWKKLCESAGLDVLEFRPGIDGITLTERAYLGRPSEYSKWFAKESPLNVAIHENALKSFRRVQVINFRKLMLCGQFVFACAISNSRGEPGPAKASENSLRTKKAQFRRAKPPSSTVVGNVAKMVGNLSDGKYHLALPDGKKIDYRAPKRFHIPRALADVGLAGYEPVTMAAFLAAAEHTDGTIFDIGANIGLYSLVAASSLKRRVVAFEPFPDAAEVLGQIVQNHGLSVRLREAALSDEVGKATFYLSALSDMSNSLNPNFRAHRGTLEVEATTIDSEAKNDKPSVIKIDTETTEMAVLRGGRGTFEIVRPYVLLEVLDENIAKETRAFFKELKYSITEIGSASVLHRIGGRTAIAVSGDARNWLASPKGLDSSFFDRASYWYKAIQSLEI